MESHYLTPSPMVKHEELMGDELMPSLFGSEASPGMESIDNWNTPDRDMMSPIPESTPEAGEKKPKKRKSWGQVLPEPKTQLPPRKRAKTEDEKEQRRVERVLRNRRAAQSSRERKRQESDALAKKNLELEAAIKMLSERNAALVMELKKVKPDFIPGALVTASSPTLSRDLFTPSAPRPQEAEEEMERSRKISHGTNDLIQNIIKRTQSPPTTINPASLSPATSPAAEALDFALAPQAAQREHDIIVPRPAVSTAGGVVDPFDGHIASATQSSFPDFDFTGFGDIPSPESSLLDFDHPPSNEFASGDAGFFDFSDFTTLHEGDGASNDQQFQQEDFAPQDPQEAPHQQPQAGASSTGRDAQGIAVAAF